MQRCARPPAARGHERQRPGRTSARHRPARLSCHAAVQARWCLDTRYGCKQEATALLQEWVQTVGRSAGLSTANVRLASGAIGVPESRLEMEVTFDSMAEWEAFLGRIPFQEHKAWSQRAASMIVDGSPVWQVHRSIPVLPGTGQPARSAAVAAAPVDAAAGKLVFTDQISMTDVAAWEQMKRSGGGASSTSDGSSGNSSSGSGSDGTHTSSPGSSQEEGPGTPPSSSEGGSERVQLDWKGDPIKFNPGDKLPFKFL